MEALLRVTLAHFALGASIFKLLQNVAPLIGHLDDVFGHS
jgi:hypothetical protein